MAILWFKDTCRFVNNTLQTCAESIQLFPCSHSLAISVLWLRSSDRSSSSTSKSRRVEAAVVLAEAEEAALPGVVAWW